METTNTGSGGIGAPLTDTQHRFKQEELHVPHGQHARNILGEMGIKAEWKHNRAGVLRKAALAALAAGAAYYAFSARKRAH